MRYFLERRFEKENVIQYANRDNKQPDGVYRPKLYFAWHGRMSLCYFTNAYLRDAKNIYIPLPLVVRL
jgi:hypothetical protein